MIYLFLANAEEIDDIEFTVTTLNCHNNQSNDTTDQQTSPQHERKPRFSSFRKSGALSKAVRSRLNLTKSASGSTSEKTEKHSNLSENVHSLDTEKADLTENGSKLEQSNDSTLPPQPLSKAHPSSKVTKKRSKLCLLL